MQEIKFEAGLRLQSLREHAVHLEGRKKLTLRKQRRPARPAQVDQSARHRRYREKFASQLVRTNQQAIYLHNSGITWSNLF